MEYFTHIIEGKCFYIVVEYSVEYNVTMHSVVNARLHHINVFKWLFLHSVDSI